jgi:hypothetical protein
MYGFASVSTKSAARGRFVCTKANTRLFIQDTVSGALLYTHPDFIRLHNRSMMDDLARAACLRGSLDIKDIMLFEGRAPRGRGSRKRATFPAAMDDISAYIFDKVSFEGSVHDG